MTKPRLLLIGLLLLASAAQAERINIAAVVNDDVITTNDVAERRDLLMSSGNIPNTVENQQRVTPTIIRSLIDEKIEMQEAKRLSITVKPEEMEAAFAQVEKAKRMPPGALKETLAQQNLSLRSLEDQLRAQISWNKVVQRKLRREVSISQDEIARAQQAAAADPGEPEVRIAAISVLVDKPENDAKQAALVKQLSDSIKSGTSIAELSYSLANRKDTHVSPPSWITESKLQPAMQQALRGMQPGEVSPPLKSLNTYQLVQLLERRTIKKVPDTTEVLLKEIALPVPAKPDQKALLALRDQTNALLANPGDCSSTALGVPTSAAQARFMRVTFGQMAPELRGIIADLGVTETSKPLMTETAVRMFMLCERIDATVDNLPPADEIRRQLFNEKIELEAQKHLRNLKRDAFIEIKGALKTDASAP